MFITIVGVDGAGKSTLLEKLKKAFPEAFFTHEPALRLPLKIPVLTEILFGLDRNIIMRYRYFRNRNKHIIADRSALCGFAYSRTRSKIDKEICEFFLWFSPFPEYVIMLDTPVHIAYGRKKDAFSIKELERIRQGYIDGMTKYGYEFWRIPGMDIIYGMKTLCLPHKEDFEDRFVKVAREAMQ